MNTATHTGIREAIRKRIVAGEWSLGERMPGEMEFAREYECARTTVNRALQALASEGIIERKRKGGTRVRPVPVQQAQLKIPLIREQVEASGQCYSHRLLKRGPRRSTAALRERMSLSETDRTAYLETLHMGDGKPFAFEQRWVSLETVPAFENAELDQLSANEWLVRKMPFTNGEVSLSATQADAALAAALQMPEGDALFTLERTTWLDEQSVTSVTFYYTSGYRLDFSI